MALDVPLGVILLALVLLGTGFSVLVSWWTGTLHEGDGDLDGFGIFMDLVFHALVQVPLSTIIVRAATKRMQQTGILVPHGTVVRDNLKYGVGLMVFTITGLGVYDWFVLRPGREKMAALRAEIERDRIPTIYQRQHGAAS